MKWMITGGAGFIGTNAVARLVSEGHEVVVLDNLSRRGTEYNLEYEKTLGIEFVRCDVRDHEALDRTIKEHSDANVILHLAGQVAVTTSVKDPRMDFEVNALGTFNVCEAVRRMAPDAVLLNTSTNKVYGGMQDIQVREGETRYEYVGLPYGASEDRPLDFHSPYGCSKGAADQYIRDYHRIFGLKTVCFRQSCIYGPRQFGVEDQGWLAWFAICGLLGKEITIYGDGKQVRDLLFANDLVSCYLAAVERIDDVAGAIFNVGGGPDRCLSVLEAIHALEELLGKKIPVKFDDWRPGDQHVFVSDIRKAKNTMGWEPHTDPMNGLAAMVKWMDENLSLIIKVAGS